jgi:hypothetical protein
MDMSFETLTALADERGDFETALIGLSKNGDAKGTPYAYWTDYDAEGVRARVAALYPVMVQDKSAVLEPESGLDELFNGVFLEGWQGAVWHMADMLGIEPEILNMVLSEMSDFGLKRIPASLLLELQSGEFPKLPEAADYRRHFPKPDQKEA